MALNPTHTFEDLDGVKCAIVEKNCTPERVTFLKNLLEHNKFTVMVLKSPPPKATPAKPAAVENPDAPPPPPTPPLPETFTVGVTDVSFSPINAVFNRELKTPQGQIVTSDYWKQREDAPKKDEWYWRK